MSTTDSGSNNSYDDELVQKLINKVEDLEATIDDQADEIERLNDTVEDQADEIDELQDEIEAKDERIEELEAKLSEHQQHSGKERAELSRRVSEVEDEIDDLEDTEARAADTCDSNPEGIDEETTALERVCALPEHVVADNLTANQRRARSVARRIKEYGRKVPAGVAITSSRIKRVLTAQEDSTIHRQTVSRVADFLERFGDGAVKIRETKGGKTAVVFDEEIVDAVTGVVTEQEANSVTPTAV